MLTSKIMEKLDELTSLVASPVSIDTQRYSITNKLLWGIFILILAFLGVSVLMSIYKYDNFNPKDIMGLILSSITSIIGFVLGYYFKERD